MRDGLHLVGYASPKSSASSGEMIGCRSGFAVVETGIAESSGSGGGGAGRESGNLGSSAESGEDGRSGGTESTTSVKPGCWEGDDSSWAGSGGRQGEGGGEADGEECWSDTGANREG